MTHINQRRDTAANWALANPILHDGEIGWERNTKKAKMGDGVTPWNSLDYIVTGEVTSVNGDIGDVVLTADDLGLGSVDNTPDDEKPVSSATATAIADAVAAALAQAKLDAHPVGEIYMSTVNTNPESLFGGEWIAWGQGRVPVGVDMSQAEFNAVEKTGGEKTHLLTLTEIPSHKHGITHGHDINTTSAAASGGTVVRGGASGGGTIIPGPISNFTGDSATAGGGTAHNNLQPYITCYMFKRVS